jgi:hypothetical protein
VLCCECSWLPRQDLTYTVNNAAKRGEKLALLRDVSGFFLPGQMSALVRACTFASTARLTSPLVRPRGYNR